MLRPTLIPIIFLALATHLAPAAEVIATDIDERLLFGGNVAVIEHVVAKVTGIDGKARRVQLKDEAGADISVSCGPEVRNFAQIAVGDTVTFTTGEAVTVLVAKAAGTALPAASGNSTVEGTPLGDKPAAVANTTTTMVATVEAIDAENRVVTLKGPHRSFDVTVGKNAPRFDRVKVGDAVLVEHRSATVITVTK